MMDIGENGKAIQQDISMHPSNMNMIFMGIILDFIIYKKGAHPSEYIFKFQVNSYMIPDKKTIKNIRKIICGMNILVQLNIMSRRIIRQ